MGSFGEVMRLQMIIFILVAVGMLLRKINILDSTGRKYITSLLINVILPCNIVQSFMLEMNEEILRSTLAVLVMAFSIQIFSWLFGKVAYTKVEERRRKVMQYGTMCSNGGFMGNPVVEGIFGAQGLMYASVYLIPLRLFMWSAGLSCFTKTTWKETLRKLAVHPCIVAVWIGFFFMGTGLSLPAGASDALRYLSNCTLPISMLAIGTILAEVNLKTVIEKDVLWYCVIRLLFLPGLTLLACRLFDFNKLVTGVCVILACMPAGSTTAILADKYNGDAAFASKIVMMSTLLSMLTIPLFCWLIQTGI